MRVLGLIVEYNPLHLGHIYHINESKKRVNPEVTIAVMSPHVVQRGDFSIVDKFTRTEWALSHGIDLVVELPSLFVLQSADQFAKASIHLLAQLGVTDVVFGSEYGDIKHLHTLVDLLESDTFQAHVKQSITEGKSYASAHGLAFQHFTQSDQNAPNDTLGVHYLKAIRELSVPLQAHTIKRQQSGYHDVFDATKTIQSASAIRAQLKQQSMVEQSVAKDVNDDLLRLPHVSLESFEGALKAILARSEPSDLEALFSVEEGLEHRLLDQPFKTSLEAYIEALKTPRYTYAKLRRTLMHVLLNTKKSLFDEPLPPYIRILGMSAKGQAHLNRVKKTLTLPLITKIQRQKHPYLAYELRVTALYESVAQKNLVRREFAPAKRTALKDPLKSAIMIPGDKR